jgi:hypothetical protein
MVSLFDGYSALEQIDYYQAAENSTQPSNHRTTK